MRYRAYVFAGLAILALVLVGLLGQGLLTKEVSKGPGEVKSNPGGVATKGQETAVGAPNDAASLQVAAAADLRLALTEIAKVFQEQTGTKVVVTFGSSGQLTQQIENGAPFDVFLSADAGYIDRLRQGGHTLPGTEHFYGRGRLTILSSPQLGRKLASLSDLLDPSIRHVAIANPDHAPYGRAAREALQASGLWDPLVPKLVYGENIQQTTQYVQTGQADAGLVALALALPSDLRWTLIPQDLHRPIDQALAVMRRTRHEEEARAFVGFVLGDQGQSILKRYGFEPRGGRVP